MIDRIEGWLRSDGDPAGAVLWRRWCELLAGPVRIGVAGADGGVVARTAARIGPSAVALVLDGEPGPGLQDRMFGVHALVWATPVTGALGAGERSALDRLEQLGAPAARFVALADAHLLERVSDDPEREWSEVAVRAAAVSPWAIVVDPGELPAMLAADPERTRRRQGEVARLLARERAERGASEVGESESRLEEIDRLLAAEDAELDAILRRSERAAGHLLGAFGRRVGEVRVDLDTFLVELEQALPAQIDETADLELARRALPHWLQHVVEGWLCDRLATARAALAADLHGLVEPGDLERIALVLPSIPSIPVGGEAQWGARLGATAALGSGAALLLLGFWLPGLAAVAGGAAWSAVGHGARAEATRARLVETATAAVRQLAIDAAALLEQQKQWSAAEIGRLGPERRDAARAGRAASRDALETARSATLAKRDAAQAIADRWSARAEGR